jgi:hypothetical protein
MSFNSNRKITGKTFTSEQGISIAGLVENGPFKFRDKLAGGQVFHVDVLSMPSSQICYVSHGRPQAVKGSVKNIAIHCKIGEQA